MSLLSGKNCWSLGLVFLLLIALVSGTSERNKETKDLVKLNEAKDIKSNENQVLYRSKTQYVKEYGIYFFLLFCLFVLIFYILTRK